MYVLYIRNYKKKIAVFCLILFLWLVIMISAGIILNSSLLFNITINNCLKFSYPVSFEIDNIYVNESASTNSVQTSLSFKRPQAVNFSTYNSLKGKFSFSYPSAFILNEEEFAGSDILYHIDFHDKSNTSRGFVQVWSLPYSLKEFLENSKKNSLLSYKYFSSKPVSVNGLQGFFWDYAVKSDNGEYYKGAEVFLQKGEKMYRISYFLPENLWDNDKAEIFWHIVNTFKVY